MRILAFLSLLLLTAACSDKPVEPSAEEMKVAASQGVREINAEIQKIAAECRGLGAVIVNPLKAMKCTSVCSFDPKTCEKIPVLALTDFKKLACAPAVGQPGWVCDYQYNVSTQSQFLMKMFTNVYGTDNQVQARFFRTEDGAWIMAR